MKRKLKFETLESKRLLVAQLGDDFGDFLALSIPAVREPLVQHFMVECHDYPSSPPGKTKFDSLFWHVERGLAAEQIIQECQEIHNIT